jgi:adenylate cyclase
MESAPRQVAILFADITGSTRLYETHGDAEALAAINRCFDVIRRVCLEYNGRVVKTVGDEAMAVFPSAANAAYASMSMQAQVAELRTSRGVALSIHVGFHFGPVIDDNADVFGDSVNVAARLSELAKSGQTLVSAQTVEVLSPSLRSRMRNHDLQTVRGKQDDIRVFELLWQDSEAEMTTLITRSVGRAARLVLRHDERVVTLDQATNVVTFGREAGNDFVIADHMASRLHAQIERRRDKFVLIDQSTNGTYCRLEGKEEIELRREELLLRGRGRISFGHAYLGGRTDVVEFDADPS